MVACQVGNLIKGGAYGEINRKTTNTKIIKKTQEEFDSFRGWIGKSFPRLDKDTATDFRPAWSHEINSIC